MKNLKQFEQNQVQAKNKKSLFSTSNLCSGYPITTVCNQILPRDRAICLANSQFCNQFQDPQGGPGVSGFSSL